MTVCSIYRLDVRTIEEADKSGTDPEDEATYADIPNVTDYRDVFQPSRACKYLISTTYTI